MFALDPFLGVRPSREYLFLLIASPAGAYFPGGVQPVTVWLSTEYVRAAPGGTGEAKCAGNYAASLVAQAQAAEQGCDQVVWLDAVERRWVEEMGGMNLYFVIGRRPARHARADRHAAARRHPRLDPHARRATSGSRSRSGGSPPTSGRPAAPDGTISRGVRLRHRRGRDAGRRRSSTRPAPSTVADGQPGAVTMKVREALLGIQHGTAPDPHGWMHRIA